MEQRRHSGWVNLLTVLVGLVTVLAIHANWVDSRLFDSQEWGDTAVEMIQNDAIRTEVSNYAVQELYDNVDVEKELKGILPPDLKGFSGIAAGGLRQVADRGVSLALEQPQVQNLWAQAVEAAHSTLVAVLEDRSEVLTTTGGNVELQLRPLIIEVADQIGLGNQARQNIPQSVGTVEIVQSDQLAEVQQAARGIRGLAIISSLLVLALIAAALALSPGYRWRTFLWIGVALVIAGLMTLLVRSVGGSYVTSQLASADIQPAAEAAYSISTELLKSMAIGVLWSSLLMFVLSWLVSPTGSAVAARGYLAVPFGRYPGATFGLIGLVAFIYLLTGIGDQNEFIFRVGVVILVALGAWFFRRQLLAEHPEADLSGLHDFAGNVKARSRELWDRRPREMPGKELLDKRRERKQAEAAARASGSSLARENAQEQTETIVLDTESARLDQLGKLGELHEKGVLSDEEFAAEKRRLLGSGD